MNTSTKIYTAIRGLSATALILSLAACGGGGGGGGGSSTESVVSRGVITQLGSIWVNGVEWETPNGGSYSSDDSSSSVADYQVGQMVSIRGRRNDDGVSGVADEVEYEAEIEGAAQSGEINGVLILITPNTNTSQIPGFGGSLDDTVRYEVSGVWINNTTIEATFIKEDDDGDGIDEIKGFVEAVVPGVSLTVHGTTYSYGGPTVVAVGDYVEIHFNGTTASSVELEDDFLDEAEGVEIEIEGAANLDTTGCPADADFKIDVTCIDWDLKPAVFMDGLLDSSEVTDGSRVEAEGHKNADGLLIADKIKGRGNRVRVTSIAGNVSVGAGTFELIEGNIQVSTMSGVTVFEDGLSINTLTSGDALNGIEVRGVRTGPTSLLAIRVKLDGLSGGGNRHELRAEVDLNGADSATGRVSVMNVVSQGNGGTELQIDDMLYAGTLTQFLDLVDDNDNPADGARDIIEIGFDVSSGDGSAGAPYVAEEIEVEEEDD